MKGLLRGGYVIYNLFRFQLGVMSTNIIYTDLNYNLITDQQVANADDYLKQTFENGDLKIVEQYGYRKTPQKVVQTGGLYWLSNDENLDDVVNAMMAQSKDWTFYYNRAENAKMNTNWDFKNIYDGNLKKQGKMAFDHLRRPIASCVFDQISNTYKAKVKLFWGDPSVFPTPSDSLSALEFYYDAISNQPSQVYCDYGKEIGNEYDLTEFISRNSIMAIFPWSEHSYFHNFEPMLP